MRLAETARLANQYVISGVMKLALVVTPAGIVVTLTDQ